MGVSKSMFNKIVKNNPYFLTERQPKRRAGLRDMGGPSRSGLPCVGKYDPLKMQMFFLFYDEFVQREITCPV